MVEQLLEDLARRRALVDDRSLVPATVEVSPTAPVNHVAADETRLRRDISGRRSVPKAPWSASIPELQPRFRGLRRIGRVLPGRSNAKDVLTFSKRGHERLGDQIAYAEATIVLKELLDRLVNPPHYAPPRQVSFGEVAGLELHSSFDRRQFGFEWQMGLPGGGNAVSWEVQVDIDLLIVRDATDADGDHAIRPAE